METEAHKRARLKYQKSPKGHEAMRRYRQRNKAKARRWIRKAWAKQKALKRGATIGDLTEIAKIYQRCEWWRQWFDVVVDHIIPFGRGGSHEAANLQIIYAKENLRKQAKLDYKPRIIFT